MGPSPTNRQSPQGPFTLEPRMRIKCAFVTFTLESGFGRCAFNAHRVIHLWRWIGTESEPNSLFIHRITIKSCTVTPPRTATLLKLSRLGHHTCCIRRPRYELRWPIMLGRHWLDAVKKETAYQKVSCSSSKFTFHIVYHSNKVSQRIVRTLVCVSMHIEC